MRALIHSLLLVAIFLGPRAQAAGRAVVHPYVAATNVYAGKARLLTPAQLGATLGDTRLAGYVKISPPSQENLVTVSIYAKNPAGGPPQLVMSERIHTAGLDFIIPEIRASLGLGGLVIGAVGAAFAGSFVVILAAYGTLNGGILAFTGLGTIAGAGAGLAITGSMLGMMGTFERGRIEEELKKVANVDGDATLGAGYIGLRSRDEIRDYHRHVSDLAHDLSPNWDAKGKVRARFDAAFH